MCGESVVYWCRSWWTLFYPREVSRRSLPVNISKFGNSLDFFICFCRFWHNSVRPHRTFGWVWPSSRCQLIAGIWRELIIAFFLADSHSHLSAVVPRGKAGTRAARDSIHFKSNYVWIFENETNWNQKVERIMNSLLVPRSSYFSFFLQLLRLFYFYKYCTNTLHSTVCCFLISRLQYEGWEQSRKGAWAREYTSCLVVRPRYYECWTSLSAMNSFELHVSLSTENN